MNETVAAYLMNPAEDEIRFGDEIAEGMLVLRENRALRPGRGASEDVQLRGQRFCRVTRLRRVPAAGGSPEQIVFVGVWVDGYQEVCGPVAVSRAWLVKKAAPGEQKP